MMVFHYEDAAPADYDEKKCATPVLSYSNKELKYSCSTSGATIHETITCPDAGTTTLADTHRLDAVYDISAYATADGYTQSETITAKLYWIDGTLEETGINSVRANTRGILIQHDDDFLTVSGLNSGEQVFLYDVSGMQLGSVRSVEGTATFSIGKAGGVVVVKVGNESVKVQL